MHLTMTVAARRGGLRRRVRHAQALGVHPYRRGRGGKRGARGGLARRAARPNQEARTRQEGAREKGWKPDSRGKTRAGSAPLRAITLALARPAIRSR
jgi:hypothetical protein